MTSKTKAKPKAPSMPTVSDLHALADRLELAAANLTRPHRDDLILAVAVIRTALGDAPARDTFALMNFGDAP